ncbi:MAG: type I-MYXAN CRISPR-associated protein Cas6/Cmx6 [Deltaproteobacteria bacterium]|nr:type I-MYXAN CRISPR-associated protein Cas6/Cmx6 [Deltaproteobacteria bacterium]
MSNSSAGAEEVVDVAFPVQGAKVPLDHGYALFSALSRIIPALHSMTSLGVHPIRGVKTERGHLTLRAGSSVTLRIRPTELGGLMSLIGKTLELDGNTITLLPPRIWPVRPVAALKAHIVTIKNHTERATFVDALRVQLAATPDLGQDPQSINVVVPEVKQGRRIMTIAGKKVVGFAVGLDGLTVTASLAVQRHGLGGRRHMGAGLFQPARG